MKKLAKSMTTLAMLASLGAPAMTFAQAGGPLQDGVSACGVPVCDVQETLEALRPLNENQRYNYINELIQTYSQSKDQKVLKNLLATAKEIKKLSQELGDADWVVRTASNLASAAILNLTKFSELQAEKIIELYKQLESATKRYEVIAHYQGQVQKLEDVQKLEELVKFAKLAQKHSVEVGDEAWIPRSAEQLAAEATVKLVAMDPGHEGVYKIRVVKTDRNILDVDKVVVLDSSSEENLVVNFINTKHNRVVLSYSGSSIVGNTLQGSQISSAGMSSKFELSFDRATGKISGTIKTTRSSEIKFKGLKTFSVSEVLKGESPQELTDLDVLGVMEGSIMGVKGTLSVQSFEEGVYSASFIANKGELKIDLVGKLYPKKGALSLTHKDVAKLVLALRKDGEKTAWRGVTFSTTNGKVHKASFKPLR